MNTATQPIRPIDLRNACEDDYARLSALNDRLRAERLPDDPPVPLEESIEEWRNIPAFVGVSAWVIEEAAGGQAVARGTAYVLRTGENEHLAQFEIGVLPEFRRQGLARRLLAPIAEFARQEGRRLLLTSSNGRVPAGEAFMRRLGAEPGQEGHTNQLDLADLDRDLLARWLREGPERAASFELGLWDAEYPEADLPAITELYAILNGAPRDNLDLEDQHYTPEQVREIERANRAGGRERWTLYARERATGAFAGFTEVFWHPNRPAILSQGVTGVFPAYRNSGLGRWLKAAMLDKVLRELPAARFVRTSNADSNAAMLKINHALGFKPYLAETVWQVPTEAVLRYLRTPA